MFYKLIEVKGYKIVNETKELIIYAIVLDNKSESYIRRWRNSNFHEVEYSFDTTKPEVMKYVHEYISKQKRVREKKPSTYGEALTLMVGTVISSPSLQYCSYQYNNL